MNLAAIMKNLFRPPSKHARGHQKSTKKRYRDKCRERFVLSGTAVARREYVERLISRGLIGGGYTAVKAYLVAKTNIKRRQAAVTG